MTVQEMINILNQIEDKQKNIYYTDYTSWCDIEISDEEMNVYILIKE